MAFLRERADHRLALGSHRTDATWVGWRGHSSFLVRRAEAQEHQDDVEFAAFKTWWDAKHRLPGLKKLLAGKGVRRVDWEEVYRGWVAHSTWERKGSQHGSLFSGADWTTTLGILFIVLFLALIH
ncbi:MAG: hypothetical protein EPN31_06185 [Castellaniella sp.]|uniref:hypothetical protein n=1 Tax=Castellaniella sp. TaxID=1955812 RepID=UPI0012115CA6|nr:hypothetical protein [Castellaniella sp.]TAN29571.1 MAG: hypothetical protein EPN31_06185 [Castellaniella sp.]